MSTASDNTRGERTAVQGAFFASGAGSLILELVWTRQFALILGSTESALSAVLAAYMAGLAIGSYLFGRWCRGWVQPLWLYATLEAGIAASALILTASIPHLDVLLASYGSLFSQHPTMLGILRFLTAFGILAIPTTLMGGTLPVLCQVSCTRDLLVERPVGQLYAVNLSGAVTGVFTAGFLLIPARGIFQTAIFAVLLSVLAAMLAAGTALRRKSAEEPVQQLGRRDSTAAEENHVFRWKRVVVLACIGVSGYAALLEEILWFRSLRLVVGSSTYALTLMLLTFLLGLAVGSHLVARFSSLIGRPGVLLAGLQGAVCFSVLGAVYLYPFLPGIFLRGFSSFGGGNGIFFLQATVAGLVLFPSAALLGAVFPVSARVFSSEPGRLGADVGTLYAVLTLGNVLGAASAIAVLANLGIRNALLAAAAMHVTASLALWLIAEMRFRLRLGLSIAMAAAIVSIPLLRRDWPPLITTSGVFQNVSFAEDLFTSPEQFFRSLSVFRLLFYREGTTATVSVYEEPSWEPTRRLSLAIDGKVDASTGDDMPTQLLLAHLPLLMASAAQDVCVIGWGSGITVGSVLQYPVSNVTAIEIEPAVVEASALFGEFNYRPISDPRLRLVADDARALFVREDRRYDVIISEPSNPWLAGPSKLFTRDFLQLGRSRLQPGGIFAQWIHLYGLDTPLLQIFLRSFHSVFPHLLAFQASGGDLVLLGSERPLIMDPQRIRGFIKDPAISRDLARIGLTVAEDLLMRFRFGEREITGVGGSGPLNTDARPALEFGAARTLYQDTLEDNIAYVLNGFRGLTPYVAPGGPEGVVTSVALRALRNGDETAARMFAQELQGRSTSARTMWLLGELAWRRGDFVTAESWWRQGSEADRACWGCAVSTALALQQENKFLEADRVLTTMQGSSRADPLVTVLHGINRFYVGDQTGGASHFRLALQSRGEGANDDIREIISKRLFPVQVLAAFYVGEAASEEGGSSEVTASGVARMMASWRAELLRQPGLPSWAGLLSSIDFHAARFAAATTEQRLVSMVTQEVLEPIMHFNRAIRHVQLGDREEARRELAEVARRVQDTDGQHYLQKAIEKLNSWERGSQK